MGATGQRSIIRGPLNSQGSSRYQIFYRGRSGGRFGVDLRALFDEVIEGARFTIAT
jgi:hypothetical protein